MDLTSKFKFRLGITADIDITEALYYDRAKGDLTIRMLPIRLRSKLSVPDMGIVIGPQLKNDLSKL